MEDSESMPRKKEVLDYLRSSKGSFSEKQITNGTRSYSTNDVIKAIEDGTPEGKEFYDGIIGLMKGLKKKG